MPFIVVPQFIQAIFFSNVGSSANSSNNNREVPLKRKGSKLAMIFSRKRERVNSKQSENHDMVNWDEDAAHSEKTRAPSSGASELRRSKNEDDQNYDENKHKVKQLSHKGSKLKILWGKHEKPHFVAMTDEMIRLETVIQSDKGRQKLVQELLALKGDFSVKVRFCSAVDTFDAAEEEKDRLVLGHTLVDMFLMHGCMFYLTMSEARRQAILEGNYNQLLDAKREVLEELSRNNDVMEIVNVVEAMDGV